MQEDQLGLKDCSPQNGCWMAMVILQQIMLLGNVYLNMNICQHQRHFLLKSNECAELKNARYNKQILEIYVLSIYSIFYNSLSSIIYDIFILSIKENTFVHIVRF